MQKLNPLPYFKLKTLEFAYVNTKNKEFLTAIYAIAIFSLSISLTIFSTWVFHHYVCFSTNLKLDPLIQKICLVTFKIILPGIFFLYLADKILYLLTSGKPISTLLRLLVFEYATNDKIGKSILFSMKSLLNRRNDFYSKKRMEKTYETFKKLTGKIESLELENGNIEYLSIKAEDFQKKVKSLGGTFVVIENKRYIKPPENPDENWNKFYTSLLDMKFWTEEIRDNKKHLLISDYFKKNKVISVNHTFFPTLKRPLHMYKRKIAFFLGNGLDIFIYNTRGLGNSKFKNEAITEASCYYDAEQISKHFFKNNNPENTLIVAECHTCLIGTYILEKYYDQGINNYFEKFPLSKDHFIDKLFENDYPIFKPIQKILIYLITKSIQEYKNKKNYPKINEDGFNSLKKLNSLNSDKTARVLIFAFVEKDNLTPYDIFMKQVNNENLKKTILTATKNNSTFSLGIPPNKNDSTQTCCYSLESPHEFQPLNDKEIRRKLYESILLKTDGTQKI
ncbi:MAG: hypothetical protein AMS24_04625 [Chlamydiae bacterium SM23_39]|nr:MAG: hypothetical protein AMS24_04625 [Chlamydiae bacterium SM23_39]